MASQLPTTQALATTIVRTLREYKRMPVDFLAQVVGRRRTEIESELARLKDIGVVRTEDDQVSLTPGE